MYNEILAGLTSASLTTIVGYPFDLVKTRMQTGNYKTNIDCIKHIYNKSGFYGYYRGNLLTLISYSIKRPIQYSFIENIKKNNYCNNNYLIGAMQAPITIFISNPLQVIKVRTQTNKFSIMQNTKKCI
jgi:solute carrier family 25 carnitine/acylcarnitine transporter 20/29